MLQYVTYTQVKSHILNPDPSLAIFPPAMVTPNRRDFKIQGA